MWSMFMIAILAFLRWWEDEKRLLLVDLKRDCEGNYRGGRVYVFVKQKGGSDRGSGPIFPYLHDECVSTSV